MRDHIAVDEALAQRLRRFAALGDVTRTPDGATVRLALPVRGMPLTLGHAAPSIETCIVAIEGQVAAMRASLPPDAIAAFDAFVLEDSPAAPVEG